MHQQAERHIFVLTNEEIERNIQNKFVLKVPHNEKDSMFEYHH